MTVVSPLDKGRLRMTAVWEADGWPWLNPLGRSLYDQRSTDHENGSTSCLRMSTKSGFLYGML